jgi:hypothetical protein
MEPTYGQIAEWLREVEQYHVKEISKYHFDAHVANHFKLANLYANRAAQVEAIGERRCEECKHYVEWVSHDWLDACKKVQISGQGPDFGCTHWKRKDG